MSNGTGIDHSDEPSDRDPAREAGSASPGAPSSGLGRAWSAVQVSRPADLLAAAQAVGSEAPPEVRPGDAIASEATTPDAAPDADATVAATSAGGNGSDGTPQPPRLPGADALAAAVAGAGPAVVGHAEPRAAEEGSAGRVDGGRAGKKEKGAKKTAKGKTKAKREATATATRDGGHRVPSRSGDSRTQSTPPEGRRPRLDTAAYERELARLYIELVKMQEWVKAQGLKVVAIFEGRDAAGKGGVIKRITEPLNPRYARVVALPAPTEREKGQWFFQRYVAHLPAAGEMVFFDRSWYNRAGVERVMGFCTDEEYREFARSVPEFERMLVRSGIMVIKYWFSVSDEEQERRFRARINDPTKRWKLSPMDLQSRARWVEYSKAKDEMFTFSDIKQAPWYVVPSDDKKRARLNCIAHLLTLIPYEDLTPEPIVLPPRQDSSGYVRPPITDQTFVPDRY